MSMGYFPIADTKIYIFGCDLFRVIYIWFYHRIYQYGLNIGYFENMKISANDQARKSSCTTLREYLKQ